MMIIIVVNIINKITREIKMKDHHYHLMINQKFTVKEHNQSQIDQKNWVRIIQNIEDITRYYMD